MSVLAPHRAYWLPEPRPEEWLLVEWPDEEAEPTKYWLSTLPDDIAIDRMVELTKLRWRIERDYQNLKQELGLGCYEGRGWRGFHHHATLCIAAYGFLIAERAMIPLNHRKSHTQLFEMIGTAERFGTKVQAKLLITLNRPRLTMASGYVSVYMVDRRRSIFV